jgi:hypothetical protein
MMTVAIYLVIFCAGTYSDLLAQTTYNYSRFNGEALLNSYTDLHLTLDYQDSIAVRDTVPEPTSVMYKSLILPGWGQVTNKQTWKVPVIYGLLAGVTAYTIYTHDRYQGYKAAYYNSIQGNTDQRFGPTPDYIPTGQPSELYRTNRNTFRNRRDLSIIGIFIVYGLNVADAYIFAHLRDFDVSDDLSASLNPSIQNTEGKQTASLTLKISFK